MLTSAIPCVQCVRKVLFTAVFSVLAAVAQGAEPATGSAGAVGDTLSWSGGPFTSANPGPGTGAEGATCDTFTLDLAIPPGTVGRVNFEIHWQDTSNDFDLFVLERGRQLGSGQHRVRAGGDREPAFRHLPGGSATRPWSISAPAAASRSSARTTRATSSTRCRSA